MTTQRGIYQYSEEEMIVFILMSYHSSNICEIIVSVWMTKIFSRSGY